MSDDVQNKEVARLVDQERRQKLREFLFEGASSKVIGTSIFIGSLALGLVTVSVAAPIGIGIFLGGSAIGIGMMQGSSKRKQEHRLYEKKLIERKGEWKNDLEKFLFEGSSGLLIGTGLTLAGAAILASAAPIVAAGGLTAITIGALTVSPGVAIAAGGAAASLLGARHAFRAPGLAHKRDVWERRILGPKSPESQILSPEEIDTLKQTSTTKTDKKQALENLAKAKLHFQAEKEKYQQSPIFSPEKRLAGQELEQAKDLLRDTYNTLKGRDTKKILQTSGTIAEIAGSIPIVGGFIKMFSAQLERDAAIDGWGKEGQKLKTHEQIATVIGTSFKEALGASESILSAAARGNLEAVKPVGAAYAAFKEKTVFIDIAKNLNQARLDLREGKPLKATLHLIAAEMSRIGLRLQGYKEDELIGLATDGMGTLASYAAEHTRSSSPEAVAA